MLKSDILIGRTYIGKSGRKRTVISEGGVAYSGQADTDTVTYIDANAGVIARSKNMTRASFASWAVSREPI